MLRNPLQSAVARGARPDLHRVADGIASSLRQFSIAQARCDDEPQRPTGRQRSAAAVKELFSMSQKDRAAQGGSQSSNGNGNGTSSAPTSRAPMRPRSSVSVACEAAPEDGSRASEKWAMAALHCFPHPGPAEMVAM
ncbi:hypothetical protein PG997_009523 [Apiospora hydei]|uniref:Uncharacterized protein n=1 Tax=Apiospora hydei TaxID=1337664 RepID=A0ABR1VUD2_9PEZI